ncbi:MAG: Flp pilus assembly complex ATPase component TadA [Oscillospiraceae bacterium]|nr:Flp pilus assembly complex ATPase component TadA [Oscillospiraceae bacterium]
MAKVCRQVFALLPDRLRQSVPEMGEDVLAQVEEIRLRAGHPLALTVSDTGRRVNGPAVEPQELELLLHTASKWSVHTVLDQLCSGFMTIEGGHRLGVAGTAVMEGERIRTLSNISSVNIRIARQIKGCARELALHIEGEVGVANTLIVAPPGAGKTTLLRDIIRILSEGGLRVCVADERGELAAMWQGKAQMDLGPNTDVLTGCPKAQAVQIMLRGMNPQVIAVDEITAPEDVRAMELAMGCGVRVLATAHAQNEDDLYRRPIYRTLLETGVFEQVVVLSRRGGQRTVRTRQVRELLC